MDRFPLAAKGFGVLIKKDPAACDLLARMDVSDAPDGQAEPEMIQELGTQVALT